MSGSLVRVIAAVAALGALIAAMRFVDVSAFSSEAVVAGLDRAGPLAPIVFVLVMAAAVVFSPIPSLPLDIAGGLYFGWVWGGTLALFGATLGAVASFRLARWIGREAIEGWLGGHVSFCSECSDHLLTSAVMMSRLVPVLSFDLVSYGAGLTAMSTTRFALATAIGAAPLTYLYTWAGPQIWSHLVDFGWLAVPVVLAFLAVPRWLEKRGSLPEHEMEPEDAD